MIKYEFIIRKTHTVIYWLLTVLVHQQLITKQWPLVARDFLMPVTSQEQDLKNLFTLNKAITFPSKGKYFSLLLKIIPYDNIKSPKNYDFCSSDTTIY